ncbi:Os09g0135200 [Oryza sativa Japonica Group]|uniref:Os09g0135200 protein n=2 Tax=Oryza sativa subsp. japonica TaxID=39947 RepID=A0A0P0XJZ0_ORYSJ|nr:hypothetical protein EE612_046186 [Oryza sativa]KAF2915216.1 hypothetical protein DAI22_09g014600 [Oryza sativa Japonica Group]BAD22284.1 unknown protein [Oryza sativa Japonica Group]BAF24551.1 Os09g0135200 [Oryza sativa Japonica Group]BAT06969.1 Os09g0135200 [Oryza sativa Japonica Group]|eukprot:NP_001062637.1 Os09g0135200 [Oryza sativa Japonica Group]
MTDAAHIVSLPPSKPRADPTTRTIHQVGSGEERRETAHLHDVFVGVPGKTQQVDGAAAAAKPRRSIGSRPPANPSNSEEHALVGSPRGPLRRHGDAAALRTRELLRPNSVEIAASDHRSSGRTSF